MSSDGLVCMLPVGILWCSGLRTGFFFRAPTRQPLEGQRRCRRQKTSLALTLKAPINAFHQQGAEGPDSLSSLPSMHCSPLPTLGQPSCPCPAVCPAHAGEGRQTRCPLGSSLTINHLPATPQPQATDCGKNMDLVSVKSPVYLPRAPEKHFDTEEVVFLAAAIL